MTTSRNGPDQPVAGFRRVLDSLRRNGCRQLSESSKDKQTGRVVDDLRDDRVWEEGEVGALKCKQAVKGTAKRLFGNGGSI